MMTPDQNRTYMEARSRRSLQKKDHESVSCLFHEDRSPSGTFFAENGWLYCHQCGFSGGILAIEMKLSGCDRETAWKNIAEIVGVPPASLNGGGGRLVASHVYRTREGIPYAKKLKFVPPNGKKYYIWFHRVGADKWVKDLADDTPKLLYNAHKTPNAGVLLWPEGEGCADVLDEAAPQLWPDRQAKGLRIASTTSPDGAWGPEATKPKWHPSFNRAFGGRVLILFEDNDVNGRTYDEYVASQAYPLADEVRIITFRDQREHYDIKDWWEEHADDPERIRKLEQMISQAALYKPPAPQQNAAAGDGPWAAESMDAFLADDDTEVAWLERDVLTAGHLTEIFAPRGLGKSLVADHWAVKLAASGKRVLLLDRDNPRRTLRKRLRSLGAGDLGEQQASLRAIHREKCPPLTRPDLWALFPYTDYDVVIVDSWNAMTEGVEEKDSAKSGLAMAALLDVCHREGGPAVLLLGNTVRSAAHSRCSGVVEDRADIIFEARDATGFSPSGTGPWAEQLPPQGADEWASRSTRRKDRRIFRLALVPTKFRVDGEPAPRMFEINLTDEPWTVTDVTSEVDKEGEAARARKAEEQDARIAEGVAALLQEIDRLADGGQPPILKTAAEAFLVGKKLKRTEARAVIASDSFSQVPGKGRSVELHRRGGPNEKTAESTPRANSAPDAGFMHAGDCRPPLKPTAESAPSEPRVNTGDSQAPVYAADPKLYTPPNGHERTDSDRETEIDRLVREIEHLVESEDADLDDDYFFAHIQGRREDILKAIQSAIDQGLIGNEGGSDA